MHENPSAGKFDPPPAPGADRSRRLWLVLGLVIAAGYPLTHWLLSLRDRGWVTLLAAGVAFGLGVLEYIFQRRRADDGQDPYSPPTSITR